jgi:hypothetical protein
MRASRQRWILIGWLVAVQPSCGGETVGEPETAAAGASAQGGDDRSTAAGGGASGCMRGAVRCNSRFEREVCEGGATWARTDFVCARTVAVDEESGAYCITKGNGTFRCEGGNAKEQLPTARYVRVQATVQGLVGLTDAGVLVAPEMLVARDLAEVATFRATNMGGDQAICPLFHDGSFGISADRFVSGGGRAGVFTLIEGRFLRAFCVWEGLMAGVRTDGTIWSNQLKTPQGNDFVDVAQSLSVFCVLETGGAVACRRPGFSGLEPPGDAVPSFPDQRYRSITATGSAACALTDQGALICQRYDGAPMLTDPGPYTFAEGGQAVLCAIRADGSVACFRHEGNTVFPTADARQFAPIDPLGPDW